jgi:hypothetical protein
MRTASGRLLAVPDPSESETQQTREMQRGHDRGVWQKQEDLVCERCFGTGMEVVSGKGARRCACRLDNLRHKLFKQARIPGRHEKCTLSNYQPATGNASQMLAFSSVHMVAFWWLGF